MISLCWGVVILVCLTHHHHVVAATEGVGVHLDRVEVGVGVTALRLVCGAPVIIPDRKFRNTFRHGVKGFSFRS